MWSDNARAAALAARKAKTPHDEMHAKNKSAIEKHKSSDGKKPKLGSGKRFHNLEHKLEKKGIKNPGALAAYIGRKKYGAKKFAKLSRKGK